MKPRAECIPVLISATPEGKKELDGVSPTTRHQHCTVHKTVNVLDTLPKDRDGLLTFYDFPAEHWDHLRTSNPIERVFATVRHRTMRTKGALS